MDKAKSGDRVRVQYSAPAKRGETDRRPGHTVLEFIVGSGTVIPGISLGVVGMAVGERKHLVLQPPDAYGAIDSKLIKQVPRKKFPRHLELHVGKRLAAVNASGGRRRVKIVQVKRNSVVVDANHPLAGKVLDVEIELIDLRQSPPNKDKPQQDLGGEG
jgi:FKBP-type peptidyl-prolyl cis-trans isomerase 2